jgi:hypothetical protein
MNCPHGVPVGPGVSCAECSAIARTRLESTATHIVQTLLRCVHGRRERVDSGGRWCPDCGAYFPKRGPVHVKHPSVVALSILLDDTGALSGAVPSAAGNDSDAKNVIPMKPRG